ncbi:DUF2513 domain-containing protein [Gottfriedia acidiceleris]|uniref:DUF2513 domain-containing protein n=1 Tax=Gottfriedia acidiceleris TaxID=371036 RepID=UPI0013EC3503|nr:DUF2513 domain-containing protein [Gottfriedia acidiceleris]
MKRDMELIRNLLFIIEEQENDCQQLNIPSGYEKEVVVYHLKLLEQANYLENVIRYADNEAYIIRSSITWIGHEFLGSIRNDTNWSKIKGKFGTEINKIPIAVLSSVAIELSKQWAFSKLGLSSK